MRLVSDPTDPDTLPERNRRGYAAWAFKRAMGFVMPDPLTSYERAAADYDLALKRIKSRDWWRNSGRWTREVPRVPDSLRVSHVVPFKRRTP